MLDLARLMHQALRIQTDLMKQDELDRKGIFLMGVREEDRVNPLRGDATKSQVLQKQLDRLNEYYGEPPELSLGAQHWDNEKKRIVEEQYGQPPRNIIDYNERCMSCSDQPVKVISAFKMACLSYKPGQVSYLGHKFSRDKLIHIKEGVMEQIEQNKGESAQIFKDLSL